MNWLKINGLISIKNIKFLIHSKGALTLNKDVLLFLIVNFFLLTYILYNIAINIDYISNISMESLYKTINYQTILLKIVLFSFWFAIGYYLKIKILPKFPKIKEYLDKQNVFKLFIIIFPVIFFIKFIFGTIFISFFKEFIGITNMTNGALYNMVEQQTGDNSNPTKVVVNVDAALAATAAGEAAGKAIAAGAGTAGDAAIMTAALAGSYKLAQKVPSTAGKLATVVSGIGIGSAAILSRKVTSTFDINSGSGIKKKFLPDSESITEVLSNALNLTGDSTLDLLTLIQYFQKIEMFLIFAICYQLIYYFTDESKLENFLIKVFPSATKLIKVYINSVKLLKKSILIYLVILFALVLIANYYSIYYLGFLIDNLDVIVDHYIKNK